MKKTIKDIIIIFIITIILLEIVLRIIGIQPFHFNNFKINSEPSQCLIPHPLTGLALHPGTFEVNMNDSIFYTATHTKDSVRISSDSIKTSLPEIHFHGCSFTYGMGVNDHETFAFLLQKKLENNFTIKNKAVPGFGNIQGLLLLENELKTNSKKPDKIIMFYADFHDMRNQLSPYYREHLYYGFLNMDPHIKKEFKKSQSSKFPFIKIKNNDFNIHHVNMNDIFKPVPLREYLSISNTIQNFINDTQHKKNVSSFSSIKIMERMNDLCKENGIEFIVASIIQTDATINVLKELRKIGIETLDMGIDILNDNRYNHLPHDSHPNALAHSIYAEKLYHYLNVEKLY